MTFKKLSRLISLFTFCSISAIAQASSLYDGTITSAEHGLFISAEGGYALLTGTPNEAMNTGGSSSTGYVTWGGNLGYAWAVDAISAISLEGGYSNNGQSSYSGSGILLNRGELKITSTDYQILAGFGSTWENGVNFFVKAGGAYVTQKASLSSTSIINNTLVSAFDDTQNNLEPMVVVGVGYMILPGLKLYVEGSGIWGNWNSNWSNVTLTPSGINNAAAVLAAKVGLSYAFSE